MKISLLKALPMNPDRLLYEIETFLTSKGSFYFLHFFLKSFYKQITDGQIRVILAPLDDAISRLETASGKSIYDIVRTEEGLNILLNSLSKSDLNLDYPLTGNSVYTAISGIQLLEIRELEDLGLLDTLKLPGLQIYITDKILISNDQITKIRELDLTTIPPENLFSLPVTTKYDSLSGDLIRKIALELSLKEILAECLTSRAFNRSICDNEEFWKAKVFQDLPKGERSTSWKKTYMLAFAAVFVMGKSVLRKLGAENDQEIRSPSRISVQDAVIVQEKLVNVNQVACCDHFTLINGSPDSPFEGRILFRYGLTGSKNDSYRTALAVPRNKKNISQMVYSANHAFWISNKESRGLLFCDGYVSDRQLQPVRIAPNSRGNQGQLGLGEKIDEAYGMPVTIVDGSTDNVTLVSTCKTRTMVINNGKLYGFGTFWMGEMGRFQDPGSRFYETYYTPRLIDVDVSRVTQMVCTDFTTLFVIGGELYALGMYTSGYGKTLTTQSNPNRPVKLPGVSNITKVVAYSKRGLDFGYNLVGIIAGGDLYLLALYYDPQVYLEHVSKQYNTYEYSKYYLPFRQPKLILNNVTDVAIGSFNEYPFIAAIVNDQLAISGSLSSRDLQYDYEQSLQRLTTFSAYDEMKHPLKIFAGTDSLIILNV